MQGHCDLQHQPAAEALAASERRMAKRTVLATVTGGRCAVYFMTMFCSPSTSFIWYARLVGFTHCSYSPPTSCCVVDANSDFIASSHIRLLRQLFSSVFPASCHQSSMSSASRRDIILRGLCVSCIGRNLSTVLYITPDTARTSISGAFVF
ncbi:hypothetical protein BKA93DRAFT_85509 [Sparassis latifolia]